MEKIRNPIIEVSLHTDLDLVLSYKNAMRIADTSGLNFTDQTKFATAVSEICRNALMYGKEGNVKFYVSSEGNSYFVEAIVSDTGSGIKNIDELLAKINLGNETQKSGLFNAKRLSNKFEISSSPKAGTRIRICRKLPYSHPPINSIILSGWRKHFRQLSPISPYDELKRQNNLLLKTLEELKASQQQTTLQIEEIQKLNSALEENYSKIKKLSYDLELQNKLLLKRNDDLDEFAYIVSHDLKSPLNNLQGLLSLAEKGRLDVEQEMIPMFKKQLLKMENLIKSILTYSRAGHEKVGKIEVDLTNLLKESLQQTSGIQDFEIEIEKELPTLYTKEILISQVFNNLISNAIKYNDKPKGKIRIGCVNAEQGCLYYFVEDNGPGIPESKREKVFHIFTILNEIEGVDSTGIGLSIVKKIVNENGGSIWIEDSNIWETGCRFCFTWPATGVN